MRWGSFIADLKPGNVMLCRRRPGEISPTVLDFGISKQFGRRRRRRGAAHEQRDRSGTIPYLAPEQTRGGDSRLPRSDQYAVALILYECVHGARVRSSGSGLRDDARHRGPSASDAAEARRTSKACREGEARRGGGPSARRARSGEALPFDERVRSSASSTQGSRRTRETWSRRVCAASSRRVRRADPRRPRAARRPRASAPYRSASTRRRYAWPAVAVTLAAALALAGARHR